MNVRFLLALLGVVALDCEAVWRVAAVFGVLPFSCRSKSRRLLAEVVLVLVVVVVVEVGALSVVAATLAGMLCALDVDGNLYMLVVGVAAVDM